MSNTSNYLNIIKKSIPIYIPGRIKFIKEIENDFKSNKDVFDAMSSEEFYNTIGSPTVAAYDFMSNISYKEIKQNRIKLTAFKLIAVVIIISVILLFQLTAKNLSPVCYIIESEPTTIIEEAYDYE